MLRKSRTREAAVSIAIFSFILLLTMANFFPISFRAVYEILRQRETGVVVVTQRIL